VLENIPLHYLNLFGMVHLGKDGSEMSLGIQIMTPLSKALINLLILSLDSLAVFRARL